MLVSAVCVLSVSLICTVTKPPTIQPCYADTRAWIHPSCTVRIHSIEVVFGILAWGPKTWTCSIFGVLKIARRKKQSKGFPISLSLYTKLTASIVVWWFFSYSYNARVYAIKMRDRVSGVLWKKVQYICNRRQRCPFIACLLLTTRDANISCQLNTTIVLTPNSMLKWRTTWWRAPAYGEADRLLSNFTSTNICEGCGKYTLRNCWWWCLEHYSGITSVVPLPQSTSDFTRKPTVKVTLQSCNPRELTRPAHIGSLYTTKYAIPAIQPQRRC